MIDFSKLKLFEKIRLATLGNAFCRQTLVRDSNRLVAMAAIRSPGITDMEVIRAAGNRAVSEDVIRYIANSKDYLKMYPVKLSLIGNPKCPLALTLKMLAPSAAGGPEEHRPLQECPQRALHRRPEALGEAKRAESS